MHIKVSLLFAAGFISQTIYAADLSARNARLICYTPASTIPSATVNVSLRSSATSSVVGLSDEMSGIGVMLQLVNNDVPNGYVNVVEGRSAAGAGWQTSYIIQDWPGGQGSLVYNQAAGNSIGYQWGSQVRYNFLGSTANSQDWAPVYMDHNMTSGAAFSPCSQQYGYLFDNGKVDVTGSLLETPYGSAMRWINSYSIQPRVDQVWPRWDAEQALYLDKKVAKDGNLRIFLKRGSVVVGPINPWKRFAVSPSEGMCRQNSGSFCDIVGFDYAVLVWNIFGRDIGIAIPNLQDGISLNMEEQTYCSDPENLTCGNISFHAWTRIVNPSFKAGQVHGVSREYIIGTLPQLNSLGFSL